MSEGDSVYNELRLRRQLCDAVVKVEDAEFQVHKLILSACSPYFRALFTHWSKPDRHVFDVSDVSPDFMGLIVEFAYTGLAPVTQDNVQHLFITADRFDVPGLLQICSEFLEKELNPENCIGIWLLADTYYHPELRQKALLYILSHFQEVVAVSEEFPLLSVHHLSQIVESDRLTVKLEEVVYEAVLQWIVFSLDERREYLPLLFPKVRLALMSPEYIIDNVMQNEMVMSCKESRTTVLNTVDALICHIIGKLSKNTVWYPLVHPRWPAALMLAIGGWSNGNPISAIEAYDARTDHWVNLTFTEEAPRAYHGSVLLNGSIYCVGGYDRVTQLSSVQRFDLETCTWHEVSPMHSRRCFVSVTMMDGCIYALGGYNGQRRLETAERYDPKSNQWTIIASMHEQRSDASSTSFLGRVYICGGFTGLRCLSSAECYDPNTNQWTVIASMSSRRSGIGVVAYANRIFAVGGFTGTTRLSTAEAYDPATNSWHTVASMMTPRSNFGISLINDCLFVVGGYNGTTTTTEVEFYDHRTEQWTDARDTGISRSALSCCTVDRLTSMADGVAPHDSLQQQYSANAEEQTDELNH